MSIKIFKGLGTLASTSTAEQRVSTSNVVDKTVRVDSVPPQTTRLNNFPIAAVSVVPTVTPELFSQDSGYASYDTIYHEFMLRAEPVYNFWTEDETTNDVEDRGDRELVDLPRYVRVSWNVSPKLTKKKDVEPFDPSKRRNRNPIKFAVENVDKKSFLQKGIVFSPQHLSDFELAKSSVANPYISPAAIRAVVEFPLDSSDLQKTPVKEDDIQHIDEDTFLDHPDTAGISINELKSNIATLTHGSVGANAVTGDVQGSDSQTTGQDFFVGKFSVEHSTKNGGRVNVKSVAASSPSISFIAASARSAEPTPPDNVVALASKVVATPQVVSSPAALQARVSFVDPSIGGLISQEKVNSVSQPEHAEMMIAVAQFIPNLNVLSRSGLPNRAPAVPPPSFPAPAELDDIEYIGYVLEKYHMNDSGAFELVETLNLDNREYSEHIDCKVVYGGCYRYRIRAMLRWTRQSNIGVAGFNTSVVLTGQTNTKSTSDRVSSYFTGEWCKQWAKAVVVDLEPPAPPDELTVRPDSSKKTVTVTCKLPYNPQRDISTIRIFKKRVSSSGLDLTEWKQIGTDFAAQNTVFVDADVEFQQDVGGVGYKYAAQCLSKHAESSTLSDQMLTKLNKDYKVFGEYPVIRASQQGVNLSHHGSFSVYPFRKFVEEVIVTDSLIVSPRAVVGSRAAQDGFYVVRVESLDTGEKFDFQSTISYDRQPPVINRVPITVYVPTDTRPTPRPPAPPPPPPTLQSKSEILARRAVATKRSQSPGSIK